MYLNMIALPLIGCLLVCFNGKYYGSLVSAYITTTLIFCSFLCSLFVFYEVGLCCVPVYIDLYTWLEFDFIKINIGFLFDYVTSVMCLMVTSISFFVHLYSMGYMKMDPFLTSFMAYLSFFTFWMLILVTSNNFVQMFIGWEGVGLCSYLLINFWFTRIQANKAALKAIIVNSIADVFFILAIVFIFLVFKTVDYMLVFNLIKFVNPTTTVLGITNLELIAMFLLLGASTKSAQIGLHVWLPDAMEGPTPVSALLHAATMVTAGVFLMISCSPMMEYMSNILMIMILLGGLTAFTMSFIAIFQYDMKKIMAYSTCSQLGYMFFSCGCSQYNIALFHLFNHAFFKALLFLGAGSIMHACLNEQDMSYYGGLVNFLPFTYISFVMGSLAMMGFPFLSGFYSKELMFEFGVTRYMIDSYFVYFILLLAALNTSIYSMRLLLYVFFGSTNLNYLHMSEANGYMFMSLFFLCLLSIFSGFFFSEIMVGYGSFAWNSSILILPSHYNLFSSEFLGIGYKNLPLIVSLMGILIVFFMNFIIKIQKMQLIWAGIFKYFAFISQVGFSGFFFNVLYNSFFVYMYTNSYMYMSKLLDKGFLEFFGPFGLYKFFFKISKINSNFMLFFLHNNMGFILFVILMILLMLEVGKFVILNYVCILFIMICMELTKK